MELLLCKNVDKLGIVGDVVNVSAGYARNYLLPQRLATEPTEANKRALAEARRAAELEHTRQRAELEQLAERLKKVEVTIAAKANEAGVLYGSVGSKEIADALAEEGHFVKLEQIVLPHSIGQLDNTEVELRLAPDLSTTIKVWVVREKTDDDESDESSDTARTGAEEATDGNQTAD